ncbi:MAG TPA: hypothetical protein PKW75_05235 [candidate division Zixibacteria bacterium]|nr:hypothetical protein [candidate division Zixibacteria bacterium]HPM36336.1 hypothetical protein [candidate division Zixibacteria bacterium]
MKKVMLAAALLALPAAGLCGQDFGIKFSGFVKSDFFHDSRQTVSLREGHFLLYPAGISRDVRGEDVNDRGSFNYLAIQTRLTGAITAPDAFGAKVSGVLEADFFGNESAALVDANGFRLRHAYAKLAWTNTELLLGQYWHPLFVPACFSEVISFNTGAPMQPFARNPQVRLTHRLGPLRLIAAAAAQRDFAGGGGSAPLRNSSIPDLNAQVHFSHAADGGARELLAGVGGEFKTLRPLLQTTGEDGAFKTDEEISSAAAMAFLKYHTPSLTGKVQGVYGQNLYDLTMLGGYAVTDVLDPERNAVAYTTVDCFAIWSEIIVRHGPRWQYALWAGYTENLGADDSVVVYSYRVDGTDVTVRGASVDNTSDIKRVLRVSPRVVATAGSLSVALETEYTRADYAARTADGKLCRDKYGKVTKTDHVDNFRVLFSTILKF